MISIAVMASGEGSNALALIDESKKLLDVNISKIIVDNPNAAIINRAGNTPVIIEAKKKDESRSDHEKRILKHLGDVDWIFLAGYRRLLSRNFVNTFKRRIINIHPSLLPKYPGLNAYEQMFNSNDLRCGASVHFVDEGMDTGPIIAQTTYEPPRSNETLGDFVARGKTHEWQLYRQVIKELDKNKTLTIKRDAAFLITKDERIMQLFFLTGGDASVLNDPIDQELLINPREFNQTANLMVRTFLPGVTDNTALSVKELTNAQSAHSALAWWDDGRSIPVEFNPLVHRLESFSADEIASGALENMCFDVVVEDKELVSYFELNGLNDKELLDLSDSNHWALSLEEMKVIQNHFGNRAVSDVEIEIIAQTWSEHCKHKLFSAKIEHTDFEGKAVVDSVFKSFIKKPTTDLMATKPWLISVFSDNAGIVRFSENVDLCLKVETHNSPSALDPYGGALTGILGVNRDILGTGLGARPIANLDVFCTGEPRDLRELPIGLKKPSEILDGIHRGVMDGGNKSGIPTVTGAMCFDETYSGKPLVFCGTLGVMPQTLGGLPSSRKGQKPGDRIVVAGGAVGLDGIHGATASSRVMDDQTPAGMVQIGDPFTQKRLTDFLLAARDQELFSSLTDNGAGGLSSSLGEMAQATGGARVDTAKVPLKYPGLVPWQIMVSESQERMSFSVPPENVEKLINLAKEYNVAAHDIGEFTNDGIFHIEHDSQSVAKIDLNFLHEGLPQMQLHSKWEEKEKQTWIKTPKKNRPSDWFDAWKEVLSDPTIASKEKWVRRYDHEVGAATAIKPFDGLERSAPNDGSVIALAPHGGLEHEAVAMAVGMAPRVSSFDPKLMAMMALDEAVRGVVASGADPEHICLLDNFCWPNPLPANKNEPSQTLGELVRAGFGLEEYARTMQMPFISGKDSMKNDFKGKMKNGEEVHIRVLPTMLATALGKVPDIKNICKTHAQIGQRLYLVGLNSYDEEFGYYPEAWNRENKRFEWNLEHTFNLYKNVHTNIKSGVISACHDLSEGGLATSLFEMLLLNHCGITLDLTKTTENIASLLFSEYPGRFVVAVNADKVLEFEKSFGYSARHLGLATSDAQIQILTSGYARSIHIEELEMAWRNS